ncbi:hypothetical protein [Spiroplasma endosymbiont of Nebria brevicollis]|uniref:hypothetical protein n=1 Tax=Spiroplasma endosymbiont of Nebria brevicollis TaxID=3066284 RepID=UPI00313E2792
MISAAWNDDNYIGSTYALDLNINVNKVNLKDALNNLDSINHKIHAADPSQLEPYFWLIEDIKNSSEIKNLNPSLFDITKGNYEGVLNFYQDSQCIININNELQKTGTVYIVIISPEYHWYYYGYTNPIAFTLL